jgi:asparagine synthase (glutamine-hydrolysing)
MSGIAGIITRNSKQENNTILRTMINSMIHESFYTSGTYVNQEIGIYAGWVCHRNSFADCMPILNEQKNIVLIFSGEDFADKDLFTQLNEHGHMFDSSNASYLVHMYEEDEEGFLKQLNGWFSGILIDLRKSSIVLFNDRFGMQRVFYHENKDSFYFSSEAKSLLRICPEARKIDMKSMGEFFSCNSVLGDRTLFKNISLLPSASQWTFYNGNVVTKDHYFRPAEWENQPLLKKEAFYAELRETFKKVLPRYFRSQQKIGMSLTGGLDSRMILAYIDIAPGALPFYTFGGMYRDCLDVKVARRIAQFCDQPHSVLQLGKEYLADFPANAERTVYISDGCLDVCGSHNIYLNRLAREIAPVRITGTFGSEILRNASGFKSFPPDNQIFHPSFKPYLAEAIHTLQAHKNAHQLSISLFKEAPWLKLNALFLEQTQLTYRAPFMDNDLVRLAYRAPQHVLNTKELSLRLIQDGNQSLLNIRSDMGFGGTKDNVIALGIQLFYSTVFRAEWYYNTATPHWMVKLEKTLAPLHLEGLILGRNKIEHHRKWFQNELSDYLQDVLLDRRAVNRPFLNEKSLTEIVNGHVRGEKNYLNEINKILTVELTYRLLIENQWTS